MKVIGLTGGIGSGKSTVAQFLAELGAVVIDADKIGHEMCKPGTQLWREVVEAFGREVLRPGGEVDRHKLGKLVFESSEARERLNRIMHGPMYEVVKSRLEEYRRQGAGVVVLEAPLLIEAGWVSLVDEVWVTVAPESTVLSRIKGRSGLSEAEALARIRAQLPAAARVRHASVVIDSNCSLDELKAKVRELWDSSGLGRDTEGD